MRFHILGSLEVHAERPLVVGAAKHRTLLAALLLGANRVQSTDRLIDLMWNDSPPATARNLVSVYVHQLRRLLADLAGVQIVTKAPGYVLRVADTDIDYQVFGQLADQARDAARRQDLGVATRLFREALAIWRGSALSDVDSVRIQDVEVPRLEESRLAVLEECLDADLALGRHAQVLAEIRALVAEYPFRERLHRQLLLALYRSGLRHDAVLAYRGLRDRLRRELAIEPGSELRQLAKAMLVGDASLDAAPGPVLGAGSAVLPVQTPPALADFTGRERELARLLVQLGAEPDGTGRVVVLTGMPGAGKSALATQVAHQLTDLFPDGQLHADLRGCAVPTDPAEVLGGFLRALGGDTVAIPTGLDERVRLFRSQVAGRRLLIVLDDAARETQVRPLLPSVGGSAVIVTSRDRLSGLEGAYSVELGPFDAGSAVQLLAAIIGPQRVAAERAAADEIVRWCDDLPLAVRIVGVRLAARPHWPLARLAGRLADSELRLGELCTGDLDVRARLTGGYHRLPATARAALPELAACPGVALPVWAVAALLDTTQAATEEILDLLCQAHFVRAIGADSPSRYLLPRLVGDVVVELAGDPVNARNRLLRCYLRLASAAQTRLADPCGHAASAGPLDGLPDDAGDQVRADPLGWFRVERDALLACVELAAAKQLWSLTHLLALAQVRYFCADNRWQDWERTHSLALEAAQAADDRDAQAAVLDSLVRLHTVLGHNSEALATLVRCLDLASCMGDVAREARAMYRMAKIYRKQNRSAEAHRYQDHALRKLADAGMSVAELTNCATTAA